MDPISKEQILLLYQDQLDNIRDLKSNQWKVSHYGLIAQAAIFSVYKLLGFSGCLKVSVFFALSVITFVYCVWIINQMQKLVAKRREALVDLSKNPAGSFSAVREKLRCNRKEKPKEFRWKNEFPYGFMFLFAQLFGAVAVIFLIWHLR